MLHLNKKKFRLRAGKSLIKMQNGKKTVDGRLVAGVFSGLFAKLAGIAIEGPRFRDFHRNKFYDNVHRLYAVEVVGEMSAYTKRGYALVAGIFMKPDSAVDIEPVAEHYLLAERIDIETAVFGRYQIEFPIVIAAVDTQPLEHIGIVFGEIQAENTPAVGII